MYDGHVFGRYAGVMWCSLANAGRIVERLRRSARFRAFLAAPRKEWERIPGEAD